MAENEQAKYLLVLVTTADAEQAARIARTLVEEKLAACGNVLSGLRSIFSWQGKIEDTSEALLLLKTRTELFEELKKRVLELHSYEVPEVVALKISAGHQPYLDWILANTRAKPGQAK